MYEGKAIALVEKPYFADDDDTKLLLKAGKIKIMAEIDDLLVKYQEVDLSGKEPFTFDEP